jgi:integrase
MSGTTINYHSVLPRHPGSAKTINYEHMAKTTSAWSKSWADKIRGFMNRLKKETYEAIAVSILHPQNPPHGPRSKMTYLSALNTAQRLRGGEVKQSALIIALCKNTKKKAAETPMKQARPMAPKTLFRATEQEDIALRITLRSIFLGALRVADIFRVRSDDVEVKHGVVRLRIRGAKGMGPSSRSYWRFIPLHPLGLGAAEWWSNHTPTTSLRPQEIQRWLQRRGYSKHSLRRGMAQAAMDNGASLRQIRDLLGHENMRSTRVYITPSTRMAEVQRNLKTIKKVWNRFFSSNPY